MSKLPILLAFSLIAGATVSVPAHAMPMFARKYKVDCSMCHAAVPRLNFTGTKFKAAGYRMPWEIGKDQQEDLLHLENYTAFISFANASATVTSNTTPPLNAAINLQEIDVHPITGSWGANWSSGLEVDFLPDGTVSANQALVGYTSGSADAFTTVQAGVIPNFVGYGILDRPIAVSTPLILSQSAGNPVINTLYNWAGPRAAGVTVSHWRGDTLLSASVRNRLEPSGGGLDALAMAGHVGDFLLSANQFFDHKGAGSAVNLAVYHGQALLPSALTGSYSNTYSHAIGGANYYLTDSWNLFAGGGWGVDELQDPVAGTVANGLYHAGGYAGLEYFAGPDQACGARYDGFRSDLNTSGTDITNVTLYYHYRPIKQITTSAEFQVQKFGINTLQNAGLVQSMLTLQALLAF